MIESGLNDQVSEFEVEHDGCDLSYAEDSLSHRPRAPVIGRLE